MRKAMSMPLSAVVLVSLVSVMAVSGCGKRDAAKSEAGLPDNSKVVAHVNKDVITQSELNRELAGHSRQDPTFKVTPETSMEQLLVMINRKMIIQEAMERGLARQDSFIRTIKSFWEQALIRDFVDYKRKEFREILFVTDDDVNKYYKNMSKKMTFKSIRNQDKDIRDKAYDKYLKDKDTTGWVSMGPLQYDEASGNILYYAFDLEKGQSMKIDDPPYYYIVEASDVEPVEVAPIEELRAEIEKRVINAKEKKMFEDWVKGKRESSKININKDAIAR